MSDKISGWERELLEREALFDRLDPALAAFLNNLHQRLSELERDADERRWAEMGDDL